MTEALITEQLANYIRLKYPDVIFHFDLSGVNNPSPSSRAYNSRINGRAWPDLFIACPKGEYYHGLFIEIKKDGTKLKKKDGTWATPHIAEQAEVLTKLCRVGYAANFGVGFMQCQLIIDGYMKGGY